MNRLPFWGKGGISLIETGRSSQPALEVPEIKLGERNLLVLASQRKSFYWPKLSSSSRLPSTRSSRLPSTRSSPFWTVWICFSSARTFLGPRYLRSKNRPHHKEQGQRR